MNAALSGHKILS